MPPIFWVIKFKVLTVCMMSVVQLDENSELYTLCFEHKGEIQPISDFEDPTQADLLKDMINNTGYSIKLSDLVHTREFSIGTTNSNGFKVESTAQDLEDALKKLDIEVDFLVEAPLSEIPEFQF